MKIPNIIPIMEDETLYSYILRLSAANGLDVNTFCNFYVWRHEQYERTKKIRYDTCEPIINFLESLSHIADPLSIFFEHTVFRIYAPFMSTMHQTRLINTVMNSFSKYDAINGRVPSYTGSIKICPECMKEDIKKHGFFWYRANHQVAGVCACHNHGCPLLYAKPGSSNRYKHTKEADYTPIKETVTEGDVLFAKNVAALSEVKPQSNARLLKTAILERIFFSFIYAPQLGQT